MGGRNTVNVHETILKQSLIRGGIFHERIKNVYCTPMFIKNGTCDEILDTKIEDISTKATF